MNKPAEPELTEGVADATGAEDVPAGRRDAWCRRLSVAIEVLLILYAVMLVSWDARNTGNVIAVLAGFAALALTILRPPGKAQRRSRLIFVAGLTVFLVVNVAAVALGRDFPGLGRTGRRMAHVYSVALALAVGLGVRSPRSARRLLVAFLMAFGLWYAWEAVSMPWRRPFLDGRLIGYRHYHTVFAMEICIVFSVALGFAAAAAKRRTAALSLLLALLAMVLLLMTKTRLALLTVTFVPVPAVLFLQGRFGAWKRRLVFVLVWVLLIGPALGLAWWSMAGKSRRSMASVHSRVEAWGASLRIFSRAPWKKKLVGHGRFGNTYEVALDRYGVDVETRLHHAHNVPLQALLESGLLGLGSLLSVWLVCFVASLKAWLHGEPDTTPLAAVLVAAMLTIAVMSQMDYTLNYVAGNAAWFLTGLAFACCRLPSRCRMA